MSQFLRELHPMLEPRRVEVGDLLRGHEWGLQSLELEFLLWSVGYSNSCRQLLVVSK